MKQVAQNYKSGELSLLDVPEPACAPGGVLVRSLYSLISSGTEMMKLGESKLSLIGKARARPDQVKKVLSTMQQQGPVATYRKAMNKLDSYTPLGYSLAGVVVEVGRGAEEFSIGQLVACAGNEFALHAEVNWVPVNLCVPVPDGVAPELAAFATVGSIAMQGVRQGNVQLGDTALVIGLGLIGQLVVQMLVANGARVIGLDMVAERCRLSEKAGAALCAAPDADGMAAVEAVLDRLTNGLGADQIFLVASSSSNDPVEAAAKLARDRATVVDIGKTKLDLPWNAYYEKELDVRFSRSYGPGRYDPTYELDGVDYPIGYVRWTERRNLGCFLDLIASGSIDPEPLISGVFSFGEAAGVYERMGSGELKGVGFLFKYDEQEALTTSAPKANKLQGSPGDVPTKGRASVRRSALPAAQRLKVGFIGAGNYASSMLLPFLAERDDVQLAKVSTRKSLSAVNAQRKFGFAEAGTDLDAVLEDPSIDAIFIVTRHSSHASLTCRALEAGKAVFVEKPLALRGDELDQVLATVAATGNDRLMVGFNRRFSPMFQQARQHFGKVVGPVLAQYSVNAGPLAADSWYRNEAEGSRFVGEGGHFIDTVSWFMGAEPTQVTAMPAGPGNVQVNLHYGDGSLATVTYFVNGHPRLPKEMFQAVAGGKVARLDNFRQVTVWAGRRAWKARSFSSPDKGQKAQVGEFVKAVREAGPMPISLSSLVATTRATLAAEESLVNQSSIKL